MNSTKESQSAPIRRLQQGKDLNIIRLAAVWLLSMAGLVATAGYAAPSTLGDFLGQWKSQDGKDLMVITPQKITFSSWRKNDAGKLEKNTWEAPWSKLGSATEAGGDDAFGLSKKQITLTEISKGYRMALKQYKKNPSDFSVSDPELSRKAIQAMSPGTYQVMWSNDDEYIVDKDRLLKIYDGKYGFIVTLFNRVK